jgi:alkylation response protein AidB-like acyl-CoA dehydrogenase
MNEFVLSEALLEKCASRAAAYDRDNTFFTEDLDDLRQAGYLLATVPKSMGGLGLTLPETCQEQRRLSRRSAPTALALNMHLGATGIAADLLKHNDESQVWILEEAARGSIFGYGYAESGNDLDVLNAVSRAEPVQDGYRLYGHRHFGSLSPVWDWLITYGMDVSDPADPRIVHAVMSRKAEGYQIVENWNTLGMRATQSHDTIIDGAFVPNGHVMRRVKPGFNDDQYIGTLFGWFEPLFGNIYVGIAERALEVAIERAKKKSSISLTRSMAYHPEVQHTVARIFIELEGMIPQVDRIAEDWASGINNGALWPAKLVAAKYRCVEGAFRVVDLAMEVSGGRSMFKGDEMERLFRDARCGRFHPANSMIVHEVVGKAALGVLGEEGLRWG